MKITIGIETTSPRLIEYGRLRETKNGWKTCSFVGAFVSARPVTSSTANPVIIHEVIVSGTFLCIVWRPSELFG